MKLFVRKTLVALSMPSLLLMVACGGGGGGATTTTLPVTPTAAPVATLPPMGPLVTIPLHGMTPTLMAYQSGTSGAWTKLTPAGSSVTFNLALGATAYSVAAYCPPNNNPGSIYRNGPAEVIVQATTADSPTILCRPPSSGSGTVNATMFVEASAFPATDHFVASQLAGLGTTNVGFGGAAGTEQIGSPLWNAGTSDIVMQVTDATFNLVAARIARNVIFTPNLDMTLAPITLADAVPSPVAVTNPAGATGSNIFWQPAEGGILRVGGGVAPSVPVIPSASAGDSYEVGGVGSNGGQFTLTGVAATTPSAITLPAYPSTVFTLTGPAPEPDLFSANCAYAGFTVTGTKYYSISPYWATTAPQQIVPAGAPFVTQVASASYLGTGTTIAFPDLSSIPGFVAPPTGGTAVALLATDYVASGPFSWDNMDTGNAFYLAPLAPNSSFEAAQSTYINFNAP